MCIRDRSQSEADKRSKGRLGGSPFRFTWEPLPSSVPFHHPALQPAAAAALEQIDALGLGLPSDSTVPVIDPGSGERLRAEDAVETIVNSVLAVPHDWVAALTSTVPTGAVAIFVSPLGSLASVSRSVLRGRGALVLDPAQKDERSALFSPGRARAGRYGSPRPGIRAG